MSDIALYAESLIATVARAFYDDEAIMLIDALIRDKFLRDDDMAPRLSLPAKKLRQTLQFLQDEHLVANETVDDLAQGGSQTTKFYYLDYCRAVHSIRLRVHLLRRKLEQRELTARSNSFYLCPGYALKRCNGKYTEEEVQRVLDMNTGLFLCGECKSVYNNDPNPPPLETYTLQLIDNAKELKSAIDQLRRFTIQLSSKFIGNEQLRVGIYDLLQKVRGGGKINSTRPFTLTSNLPSENFALGLGSKRLAGTGRTAGIKAKKLELSGVASSAAQARSYLVGSDSVGSIINGINATSLAHDVDLLRLTNAMGQKVQFQVERGGGARAHLLASRKRLRLKILDAAASRIGVFIPLNRRVQEESQLKATLDVASQQKEKGSIVGMDQFEFLRHNIDRGTSVASQSSKGGHAEDNGVSERIINEDVSNEKIFLLVTLDDDSEATVEMRRVAFLPQYKVEMDRQSRLLMINEAEISISTKNGNSQSLSLTGDEDNLPVIWEDGDVA